MYVNQVESDLNDLVQEKEIRHFEPRLKDLELQTDMRGEKSDRI
jgi:hypothetical protein